MIFKATFFENANFNTFQNPYPLIKSNIVGDCESQIAKLKYLKLLFNTEEVYLNSSQFTENTLKIANFKFIANYVAIEFINGINETKFIKFYNINDFDIKSNMIEYLIQIDYVMTYLNLINTTNFNCELCNNDIDGEQFEYENVLNATFKDRYYRRKHLTNVSIIAQITYKLYSNANGEVDKTDLFVFRYYDLFNDIFSQTEPVNRIETFINFVSGIYATNISTLSIPFEKPCQVDRLYLVENLNTDYLQNENSPSFPKFNSHYLDVTYEYDNISQSFKYVVNERQISNFNNYFKLMPFYEESKIDFTNYKNANDDYFLTDVAYYNYKYQIEIGTLTKKIKIANSKLFNYNDISLIMKSNGIDEFTILLNINSTLIDITSDFIFAKNVNFTKNDNSDLVNAISNSSNAFLSVASVGNVGNIPATAQNLLQMSIKNDKSINSISGNGGNGIQTFFRNIDLNIRNQDHYFLPVEIRVSENLIDTFELIKLNGAKVYKVFNFADLILNKITNYLCIRESDFYTIDNNSIYLQGNIELIGIPENAINEISNAFKNGIYIELVDNEE